MNKTTNINTVYATKNNSFSWNRVKMLSNFYLPVTKYQMIVYAIAAFAISIISILLTHSSPAPLTLKTKIFTLLIYLNNGVTGRLTYRLQITDIHTCLL